MKFSIAYPNRNLTYSETFIRNQLNNLKAPVTLTGGWLPYLDNGNRSIFSFPFTNNLLRASLKKLSIKRYKLLYTRYLTHYLLKYKIELVLAEYGITGSNMVDACKSAGTKLIVHFHGFDAFHTDTINSFKKEYIRMFDYCTSLVVVSDDMKNQLIELGANQDKIHKIPYGIDSNKFSGALPENNPPIFIFVGRFTAKKAPILTLKAFAKVVELIPEAKLIMVGSGELFDETVNLANKLELQKQVEFAGVQNPESVAKYLKSARCFVQHSVRSENGDSEGLPNTILEACASGLPVVSTKHAGIKEAVIHGETGFLCEEGDFVAMSEYMLKLGNNPKLAGEMGKNASIFVKNNYNLDGQIQKLRNLILSK